METLTELRKQGMFITVSLTRVNAAKLKALNKGSYEKAIDFLLNNKVDDNVNNRLKELEDRIAEIQTLIERIVQSNKLRTY